MAASAKLRPPRHRSGAPLALLLLLGLACAAAATPPPPQAAVQFSEGRYAPCKATAAQVGFRGSLQLTTHRVAAALAVLDDCNFVLSNFTFDGRGPAIALLGVVAGGDPHDATQSFPVTDLALGVWRGSKTVVVNIEAGASLTWDNIAAIHVWCQACYKGFGRSYGSVTVGPAPAGAAQSPALVALRAEVEALAAAAGVLPPAPPPAPGPAGGTAQRPQFDNCVTLAAGRFNVHWTMNVSGGVVTFGLEALVPANSWLGLGFSRNQTHYQAIGSDVAITGVLEAGNGGPTAFAVDFAITSLQPCRKAGVTYAGVCPDSLLGGPTAGLNNVHLDYATRQGGITVVAYTRPLRAEDAQFDVDLRPGAGAPALRWAVFATGPLSTASTSSHPVPLATAGYSHGGARIVLTPGQQLQACRPLLGAMAPVPSEGPSSAPVSPPASGSDFVVTMPSTLTKCQVAAGDYPSFHACRALRGGLSLMWSLDGRHLALAFSGQLKSPGGWLLLGLSLTMTASSISALVAFPSASGSAAVQQVNLSGHTAAANGGLLQVVGASATIVDQLLTVVAFLDLPDPLTKEVYIVWSSGSNVSTQPLLLSQDGLGALKSAKVDLRDGKEHTRRRSLWAAHGVVNVVGWGVLLPLGAWCGRFLPRSTPVWLLVHAVMQTTGYFVGVAGFVIGVIIWGTNHNKAHNTHFALALVLLFLATMQVLAALLRPKKGHSFRPTWHLLHAFGGLVILLLAAVQIFVGLRISYSEVAYTVAYGVWLGSVGTGAVVLELLRRCGGSLYSTSSPGKALERKPMEMEKSGSARVAEGGELSGHSRASAVRLSLSTEESERPDLTGADVPVATAWARELLHADDRARERARAEGRRQGGDLRGPTGTPSSSRELLPTAAPGSRAETRGVDGGGKGLFLRIEKGNEVVDRRSGELTEDSTALGGSTTSFSALAPAAAPTPSSGSAARPPSPRPPKPRPSPRLATAAGKMLPARQGGSRLLGVLHPSASLQGQPHIRVDKYNVKATVVRRPDFLGLGRQFPTVEPKEVSGNNVVRAAAPQPRATRSNNIPVDAPRITEGSTGA
eukprot:SM000186S04129  [mRNA]  locus=s186:243215:248244:+ [translate_table: standard]